MYNILVIDHNFEIKSQIEAAWKSRGFLLQWVERYETACELIQLAMREYCLVTVTTDYLKERTLPAIQAIRQNTDLPIIVLTSNYRPEEQMQTLELGADCYLPIPKTFEEGVITGYSLIRRYQMMQKQIDTRPILDFSCGLSIHLKQRRAMFKGQNMNLARREFDLLCCFTRNHDIVLEHSIIYENVWRDNFDGDTAQKQLWNSIGKLRRAFSDIDNTANYIKTEKHIGYRFSFF